MALFTLIAYGPIHVSEAIRAYFLFFFGFRILDKGKINEILAITLGMLMTIGIDDVHHFWVMRALVGLGPDMDKGRRRGIIGSVARQTASHFAGLTYVHVSVSLNP